MLFVFGKRAKQLRLNKVSELIHNSAGRQDIEQAQVSVYFQEIIDLDDDNFEAIPGTQFVVSRTAHRSNKSDYFIDGRKSNFTEVTTLLKGKGIDLDNNRFLILQGEVEQISMMKPKAQTEHETGLLEYLEDIIGTNRFLEPLKESAKRLEEFGEARAGLVARVKIAEKEREALEADKLAAEAYLDKEREARSHQRVLAHTFEHMAKKNVQKIEANVAKLEEKLAHERAKSGDYKSTLAEHEKRFEAATAGHAAVAAELESVTERFREYERKDIAFREELKHCRAKLAKGAEREERERAKLEAARAEAARGAERVPELRALAARSATQLEREESKLEAALEASLRTARGRLAQRQSERSAASSNSAVASALREAASSGAIPGILGRLGDLGAIDPKYDVAVSSAAPSLDHWVVDGTPTAQRCVELLRARSLGVATFLILERQRHLAGRAAEKAPETPEGVPRLLDLVRVRCADAEAARLAFYFALRDTLVASDLEQATRIAYAPGNRRWRRVVTLAGEMALAAERPRLRLRLEGLRGRVADATQRLEALESQARSGAKSAAASASEAARERRIQQLERAVAAADAELERVAKDSCRLAAGVQRLERELEAVGASRCAGCARPSRRWRPTSTREAEAARLEAGGGAAGKQVEKLERELARAARELEGVREKQERTKREFKELEEAAFAVLEAVNATQALLQTRAGELEAIRGEYERCRKEFAIVREVEEGLLGQLEAQRAALREEAAKQRHWRGKAAKADEALLEVVGSVKVEEVVGGGGGEEEDGNVAMADQNSSSPGAMDVEASSSTNNHSSALLALTDDYLDGVDTEALQYQLTMLQEEMQRCSVDLGAIEAWRAKDAEYASRVAELERATAARDEVRRAHDDLRKQRLDGFMGGFNAISLRLKEMYQMITLGGDAELELVDSLDPFSEGILFSVRPPKKSWKNIANLSGGEKTLSSLSLVFALHHYKPTPLYVMDEIDAALDFKNVSIVGHYIKERTKNAQFVIISLRNNMFELADRLVGIYKTDNATKSVAIDPGAFVVGGQQAAADRLIAAA
ncbi:hypothetical protein QBZ16_004378 [Prototheca wickerhamii]|uniref:Structural maintenance of chromosomes protein 4 n=1 Tax=Prototheca wickerhamii TaxID=3111 RepID=A0AAD9IH83_PROWI|nr:hypothetical protein QBZ16_004378 [Prototheca wickerhamii]